MRPRSLTLWPLARAHSRIWAVRLSPPLRRAGPRPAGGRPPPPPARTTRRAGQRETDVLRERVTERRGVLVAQVDLVGHPVQGEGHGLVGAAAVEVVDQDDLHFLCHGEFLLNVGSEWKFSPENILHSPTRGNATDPFPLHSAIPPISRRQMHSAVVALLAALPVGEPLDGHQ